MLDRFNLGRALEYKKYLDINTILMLFLAKQFS
jgi:hypothetical protein